jgi:fatty-acyl-CoA synthase
MHDFQRGADAFFRNPRKKRFSSYDRGSLRTGFIGGSLYTPEFFRKVEASFGFSLAPSLGQTEATAGITFISPNQPQAVREVTIGAFMEGIEGKICDIKTGEGSASRR